MEVVGRRLVGLAMINGGFEKQVESVALVRSGGSSFD